MLPYVIVVIVLILGGLCIIALSKFMPWPFLKTVALIVGCVLAVVGLILAIRPAVDFVADLVWGVVNGGH